MAYGSGTSGTTQAQSWQDVGGLIPPDANAPRVLAPGVVLEGIGQDVEGKTFISSSRDVIQTRDRQDRFVLVTKDGRTLEPSYYTSLPRANGQLWEKFTFDTGDRRGTLDHFQLQTRPAGTEASPVAPSSRDEILAQAAAGGGPASSQAAPPGRYGLQFDGQRSYLYVPDSESLRRAALLTVEVWLKPQFPPGPYTHRPGWAILSQGCYTGEGRVTVHGSGLSIARFHPDTGTIDVEYREAIGKGIESVEYGGISASGWIHLTHTFSRHDYVAAPGQPLVIGHFLTPTEDPFPGQIGEIRLWDENVARAADIERYSGTALTGNEPGLIACWTFEEGSGQIAYDLSPNHNHARLGSSLGVDDADPKWVDLAQNPVPLVGEAPPGSWAASRQLARAIPPRPA